MTLVIAFVSVVAFILALWVFRIVPLGAKAISISKDAVSVMRDDRYNDLEREKAVQQYSVFEYFICHVCYTVSNVYII